MKPAHRMVCFVAVIAAFAIVHTANAQLVGRVSGQVLDEEGNPVEGVKVTATTLAKEGLEETATTNKKGKFLITHKDATHLYVYRLEKDGYETLTEEVDPEAGGGTVRKEFVLKRGASKVSAPATPGEVSGGGMRALQIYNDAVKAQQNGDYERAQNLYEQALKIDSELAAAHSGIAVIAQLRGDYPAAAAAAEKALELDPNDVRAMEVRFDAYRQLGDQKKADEAAAALQAMGDSSEIARRVHNEAVAAFQNGDAAGAVTKLQQAVRLDPELVPAYAALAKIYARDGDYAEAAKMAAEVVKRDPNDIDIRKVQYDAANRLGDMETAAQALAVVAAADPAWAASGLFDHAVSLFNEGHQAAAAVALEEVLKAAPDNAHAHYLLGMVRFNSGEQDEAKKHLSRFIELAPEDPDAAAAREILKYME
jgi:tetratricopeptide (TPR) repeat protein